MLDHAMERLTSVLVEETRALRVGGEIDLRQATDRKIQGLMDLRRAAGSFDPAGVDPLMKQKINSLNEALRANKTTLSMHVDAMRQVTATLADVIKQFESDGTYLPHAVTTHRA